MPVNSGGWSLGLSLIAKGGGARDVSGGNICFRRGRVGRGGWDFEQNVMQRMTNNFDNCLFLAVLCG